MEKYKENNISKYVETADSSCCSELKGTRRSYRTILDTKQIKMIIITLHICVLFSLPHL